MKKEFEVVEKEVAESEFERFAEEMDIDIDTEDLDAEDLTAFTKQRKKIVIAIGRGALVINDSGEAIYTPQNEKSTYKEAITFHERTGASLMAQDGKKKNQDVRKMYAILGDMCKQHSAVFAGLHGTDVKVCEALFSFLMD